MVAYLMEEIRGIHGVFCYTVLFEVCTVPPFLQFTKILQLRNNSITCANFPPVEIIFEKHRQALHTVFFGPLLVPSYFGGLSY